MSSALFGFGLNGLIFSLALAVLAAAVQVGGKRPGLAHLLWLLVLLKLLTPALVAVPGWSLPGLDQPAGVDVAVVPSFDGGGLASNGSYGGSLPLASTSVVERSLGQGESSWPTLLTALWLAGSALLLLGSAVRMARFRTALKRAAVPVAGAVQDLADQLGQAYGLGSRPRIVMVDARVSPLVWWIGGRPQVVVPAALCEAGCSEELRWSLAHELGHLRRGDHFVRWLEWLAVIGFWWNPVAWWARRNLRINEEICCDRLVVTTLQANPRTYANSLLNVVEFLAKPELRPPALASGMNSGDVLETRLQMILRNTHRSSTPRWMRALSLSAALAFLPLGFANSQEPANAISEQQYQAIAARLNGMVEAGDLSHEEALRRLEKLRSQVAVDLESGAQEANQEVERKRQSQRQAREEYARIELQVKALVEAGRLTEEDAKARLEGARRSLAERNEVTELSSVTDEEFRRAVAKIDALVEAGRMSQLEADERLLALRAQLGRSQASAKNEEGRRINREYYAARAKKLNAMVEAGQMTHKHALLHLETLRRNIELADQESKHMVERHVQSEQYKRAAAEVQKLVEAGEVKPEDAEQRIIELQEARDPNSRIKIRSDWRTTTVLSNDLLKNEERKARVKNGPQTPEQVAKSVVEEARAEAMDQATEVIMQAVRDGKISKQEAMKRLEEMRRAIAESEGRSEEPRKRESDQAEDSPKRGITREQYRQIEAKIDAAVEAGRMSTSDAKARKDAARKLIRDS